MGTKDTTQKRLEDFEDIFADISNVLLYNGEDFIKENELETVTAKDTYTVEQQIHEVERDVAKRWRHHSLHISLIGLENQTDPDTKCRYASSAMTALPTEHSLTQRSLRKLIL